MGVVKNYGGLLATRLMLGVAGTYGRFRCSTPRESSAYQLI